MNYNNPFINPYGMGSMQQAMPYMPSVQPQQQVVRVNGENGARSYQLGANSSAMLLDESGLMVWLITSDGAGYKTVTPYDITPHQEVPKPDFGTLESRIQRLEEIVNGNTKRPAAAGKKQSEDAAA